MWDNLEWVIAMLVYLSTYLALVGKFVTILFLEGYYITSAKACPIVSTSLKNNSSNNADKILTFCCLHANKINDIMQNA